MALTVLMALARRGDPVDDLRAGRGRPAGDRTGLGDGELSSCAARGGSTCRCSACRSATAAWSPCWRRSCCVVVSGVAASRMGGEFIPSLDEGDIAMHAHAHSRHQPDPGRRDADGAGEGASRQFPEVKEVVLQDRHGRGRDRSDAAERRRHLHHAEAARRMARPDASKADLVAAIEKRVEEVPGNNYEFTQPIQMRFNELISGVRSDRRRQDLRRRPRHAAAASPGRCRPCCRGVAGAADVKTEQVSGLPVLTVELNRVGAVARYGISVADVQEHRRDRRRRQDRRAWSSKATGASTWWCGCRSICASDIEAHRRASRSRCRRPKREQAEAYNRRRSARPLGAAGRYVPLSAVAQLDIAPGPNQISRENGKRRIVVTANVRDRDLGSFVAEAQRRDRRAGEAAGRLLDRLGRAVRAARLRARERLTIVVPVALLLIFLLLFMSLGSVADAAAGVQRRAAGADRRHRGARPARHSAVDQRRRRLHRAVGRRGAERPRDHRLHPGLARTKVAR